MIKHISKKLVTLFLFFVLCACVATVPNKPPLNFKIKNLEIYLSHVSVRDILFENYKLSGNRLFYECGKIIRGKQTASEENFIALDEETLYKIIAATAALDEHATRAMLDFPVTGSNDRPYDPGILELTLVSSGNPLSIATSLDAIAKPKTVQERFTKNIVNAMREASDTDPCGNERFFGFSQ